MSNAPDCPECNAAPLRLHAPGCNYAEQAEAAYLRQGYEVALRTNFVDLEAMHAHARHILDTCDGGRLMLNRFRHWVERAEDAEREAEAAHAILDAMLIPRESQSGEVYTLPERVETAHQRREALMGANERLLADLAQARREARYAGEFYVPRMEALQEYQRQLPEPHRTVICNILANGKPKP